MFKVDLFIDKEDREEGFSMAELLVVIVIIGIISAIAIGAFLNQRKKAFDASAAADLDTVRTAVIGEVVSQNSSAVKNFVSSQEDDVLTVSGAGFDKDIHLSDGVQAFAQGAHETTDAEMFQILTGHESGTKCYLWENSLGGTSTTEKHDRENAKCSPLGEGWGGAPAGEDKEYDDGIEEGMEWQYDEVGSQEEADAINARNKDTMANSLLAVRDGIENQLDGDTFYGLYVYEDFYERGDGIGVQLLDEDYNNMQGFNIAVERMNGGHDSLLYVKPYTHYDANTGEAYYTISASPKFPDMMEEWGYDPFGGDMLWYDSRTGEITESQPNTSADDNGGEEEEYDPCSTGEGC